MVDRQIEFGSEEYREIINQTYNEEVLKCMDITERNDFYGIVAWRGMRFFGEELRLTPDSHLLDLGSGIGGPARFLAKAYGCKVTGIDLSEFNHRTAQERTREAGLDHLVNFLHGNALEIPFAEESFTHVFGCEAWCYFPNKVQLYKAAYRVLKPGGVIAFLEAACDTPVRLHTEKHLAPVQYESIAHYTSMLQAAGFEQIQRYDTTELAFKDIASSMYRLITKRDQIIGSVGAELYFALMEIWAEFLAYFSEGKLTHCGFIAQKKSMLPRKAEQRKVEACLLNQQPGRRPTATDIY
jgi:ubiquinone/menaquinone biosynthesis C-methylase UbiE